MDTRMTRRSRGKGRRNRGRESEKIRDRTHSTVIFLEAANVCSHGEGRPGLGVYDESTLIGTEGAVEVAHGLCCAAWMEEDR